MSSMLKPSVNEGKERVTVDEHGLIDLPEIIDYVLEETAQEDLLYVGISQGVSAFLIMASSLPQYNQKEVLYTAGVREALAKNTPSDKFMAMACQQPASALCQYFEEVALNFESKYVNKKPVVLYDVSNITVPIRSIYSTGDQVVPPPDVKILLDDLGVEPGERFLIKDSEFGHFNFRTAAFIIKKYVLDRVLSFFQKYK
ncbi:uncharacterized protein LOC135384712 [Ornithodoros turicata]|uniref:uncharacterized protein LOC135384712 n=1 Tax=Ornithodoros turicata TaxID=34597 RepID=UPI0031386682